MIRKAEKADIGSIIRLGKDFISTAWEGVAETDEASLADWLVGFIANDAAALFVADTDREGVVGMIGGLSTPLYFNYSHLHAQEMFWWVDPSQRASRVGVELLNRFEKWAKDKGAKTIQMGTVAKINPETLAAFYERKGYESAENSYIKVIT